MIKQSYFPRHRERWLVVVLGCVSRGSAGAEGANVVGPNKVYWTSMASLVLEVYMHFLPAYQW